MKKNLEIHLCLQAIALQANLLEQTVENSKLSTYVLELFQWFSPFIKDGCIVVRLEFVTWNGPMEPS